MPAASDWNGWAKNEVISRNVDSDSWRLVPADGSSDPKRRRAQRTADAENRRTSRSRREHPCPERSDPHSHLVCNPVDRPTFISGSLDDRAVVVGSHGCVRIPSWALCVGSPVAEAVRRLQCRTRANLATCSCDESSGSGSRVSVARPPIECSPTRRCS